MENKFTITYFIKKFEAIPEALWITGALRKMDKCCVQGHCMYHVSELGVPYQDERSVEGSEAWCIINLFKNHFGDASDIVGINNGYDSRYQQPTPKQRILAALYDIKKMQEKETPQPKPQGVTMTFEKLSEVQPIYQS